jgi:hypothetical protein
MKLNFNLIYFEEVMISLIWFSYILLVQVKSTKFCGVGLHVNNVNFLYD